MCTIFSKRAKQELVQITIADFRHTQQKLTVILQPGFKLLRKFDNIKYSVAI
jgi:hypothetical protein